jgi:cyclophilin family peptidyl-prolyl cis-trans isomerase
MVQQGVATFTEEAEKIYTTLGGTPHLDGAYTVFGEVVEGLEILDSIAALPCDAYNRPIEDVSFTISLLK